jgi:hypothetical protein
MASWDVPSFLTAAYWSSRIRLDTNREMPGAKLDEARKNPSRMQASACRMRRPAYRHRTMTTTASTTRTDSVIVNESPPFPATGDRNS